jgi:hypothetical protein
MKGNKTASETLNAKTLDQMFANMVEQHVLLGRMADLKIEKLIYSEIQVDRSYINLFTFNTIDLDKMELRIKIEKNDGCLEVIEERNFTVKNVLGLYQV